MTWTFKLEDCFKHVKWHDIVWDFPSKMLDPDKKWAYVIPSSKTSLKSKNMIFFFHFLLGYCFDFNLVKTSQRLGNLFQRYKQLKDWTNNKKQKKLLAMFGCILKTVFASSDSFCLVISYHIYEHIQIPPDRLHRSHMMQYHCGYCKFEYCWGYAAAIAVTVFLSQ